MGWQASCVLSNEGEPGYFGTFPMYECQRTTQLLHDFGYGSRQTSWLSNLSSALTPTRNRFAIGAYLRGVILTGVAGAQYTAEGGGGSLLRECLRLFPQACILSFELQSVVNYFAYTLCESGQILRAFAGDANDGVHLTYGDMQPEEKALLLRTQEYYAGQTSWTKTCSETDTVVDGESLVFAMTERFFGLPLDQFESDKLGVEIFKRKLSYWPFSKKSSLL